MTEVKTASFGRGTILGLGKADGPPETFDDIPGLGDIDFDPGGYDKPELVDITQQATPALLQETMSGMSKRKEGSVKVPIQVDIGNTVHLALDTMHTAGTTKNFKLSGKSKAGTAKVSTFSGIVTGFPLAFPLNKEVKGTLEVSIVEGSYVAWS